MRELAERIDPNNIITFQKKKTGLQPKRYNSMDNIPHTQIKRMRELAERIDPNNIINFQKKKWPPTKDNAIRPKRQPQIDSHTLGCTNIRKEY